MLMTATAAAQTKPAVKPTAGYPLVSPTTRRILYESNRSGSNQLWIVDDDSANARQLTNEPTGIDGAQWAEDGKSLFYYITRRDTSTLYELWPDSAKRRQLGVFPGRSPQVSPGRAQVIYAVGPWETSRLMLTDINQRATRQITDDAHAVWKGVWSPDGKSIAYTASNKDGIGIWVMNADGSNAHKVSHLTVAEGRAQVPAWSRDSQQLAFQASSSTARGKSTIWIIDVRTLGEREVLPHSAIFLDETPSWFPDDASLAFQSNRSGGMQVWMVGTNGVGLHQITR